MTIQRFADKYEARAHLIISLIKNKLTETDIIKDLDIAENDCLDLYVAFDDDIPMLDKIEWNAEYFYFQAGCLKLTFSKERIYHVLEVREYLREIGVAELQPSTPPSQTNEVNMAANNIPDRQTPRFKNSLPNRRFSDSSNRSNKGRNK